MNYDPEIVESARKLLRIIGYDSVLTYFAERLEAGKDLPSRPQVISAYGKLAGADEVPLLKGIACDPGEQSDSRVAAIEALAHMGRRDAGEAGTSSQITPVMIALLDDEDSRVRNASASILADLGVEEAASELQRIFEAGELDTLTEKRVRSFLLSSGVSLVGDHIPTVDDFIGRQQELRMLNQAFHETNLVMLVGPAGIGKTALAAEFATQASYDLTLWLSSWRQRTRTDLAIEALRQIELQVVEEPTSAHQEDWKDLAVTLPWESTQAKIIQNLEDRRALVVLDNYDTFRGHQEQELSEFVGVLSERLPRSHFLVVGRARPSLDTGARLITLGPLDMHDARDLLEKTLPSSLALDTFALAEQVEKSTEGNPLLIRLLATEIIASEKPEDTLEPTRRLEAYLASIVRYLDSSQRRALDVLAQFDEPVNVQDPGLSELFEQEHITYADTRNLLQTGLFSSDDNEIALIHSVIRDYIRKRSPIRTTLRTNRTIARFYQEQGEYLRAANHLVRAEEPAEAVEAIADHVDEIIDQGHASDAYKYLVDELSPVEGGPPSVNLSRLIAAGSLATFLGDVHEAIQLYKIGLEIAQRLGDGRSESELLGRLAYSCQHLGDSDTALALQDRALDKAREQTDQIAEAAALSRFGAMLEAQNNFEGAKQRIEQALDLEESVNNRIGMGENLYQLARLHYLQGDHRQAYEKYQEAQRRFASVKYDLGVAQVLKQLGMLARVGKQYGEARNLYEQSLAILERLGARVETANLYRELGLLAQSTDEYEEAHDCFSRALTLSEEAKDGAGTVSALMRLGELAERRGVLDEARELYERSLITAAGIGNQASTAAALRSLGNLTLTESSKTNVDEYAAEVQNVPRTSNQKRQRFISRRLSTALMEKGHERFRSEIVKRNIQLPRHGAWEVSTIFAGMVPERVPDQIFLDLIGGTNPRYTGWPVWADSRGLRDGEGNLDEEAQPYLFEGGWETLVLGTVGGIEERLDFWRAEPTGRFYLYRALQDDLVEVPQPKDGTTLDFTQATLRTAEAIAVALTFARAMGLSSEETTLYFTFRWSGLEGRELSAEESSEPSIPLGYICNQNTIRSVVAVPMETPTLALGQVVQDATAPLFAAFEGFRLPRKKVDKLTARLLSRNVL